MVFLEVVQEVGIHSVMLILLFYSFLVIYGTGQELFSVMYLLELVLKLLNKLNLVLLEKSEIEQRHVKEAFNFSRNKLEIFRNLYLPILLKY